MTQINNLKLELLTEALGEPEKQSGDEYLWQCPLCKETGRGNLKFNAVKGICGALQMNATHRRYLKKY